MKPGEDSTGGVWEVGTATPGAVWTILPVRVTSKDALPVQHHSYKSFHILAGEECSKHTMKAATAWHLSTSLLSAQRQMMCGLIETDSGRHTAFS